MPSTATIVIQEATSLDTKLLEFLKAARGAMFAGRFDPDVLPADLLEFERHYARDIGFMLVARAGDGDIVGTIALRAYDHRFTQFAYPGACVAEVVRLYVNPTHRRQGLATTLVRDLKLRARTRGIDVLYLHTHPFLPNAVEFWEANAFRVLEREAEPVWQTIHMDWHCG